VAHKSSVAVSNFSHPHHLLGENGQRKGLSISHKPILLSKRGDLKS
jgi:hypothetical protein